MNIQVAGIDYSLTCPAVCTYNGCTDDFNFVDCNIYFLSDQKKYDGMDPYLGVYPFYYKKPENDIERYDYISSWAYDYIVDDNVNTVYLEGYSMSSKGRVFNIAENTAILKYKLWISNKRIELVPPTVVKKFATTKGTSNKNNMYSAFFEETNVPLVNVYQPKTKDIKSPVSDIVDAYFLCKYALFSEISTK